MELFYAYEVSGRYCRLDAEESGHCVRVLRHRAGDEVDVIDGRGALYHCRLTQDSPKGAEAEILSQQNNTLSQQNDTLSQQNDTAAPPRTTTVLSGSWKRPRSWAWTALCR